MKTETVPVLCTDGKVRNMRIKISAPREMSAEEKAKYLAERREKRRNRIIQDKSVK